MTFIKIDYNKRKNSIFSRTVDLILIEKELIILSCFYDYRYNVIRILGLATRKIAINCSYVVDRKIEKCNYKFINYKKDSAGKNFKYLYINILVSIKNKLNIPNEINVNDEEYIVLFSNFDKRKNTICIATMKQFVSYNLLSQTINLYGIYGINNVFLYISDNTTDINKLKIHKNIILNIIKINNDYLLKDSFYFGQTLKYNDCLYRNMFNSNYIIFNDFDEFIVLRNSSNYLYFLKSLEYGDIYYFRSAICPTSNYTENKKFHIIRDINIKYTLNCCILNSYFHRKYIITSPSKFIKINIHYIDYTIKNCKHIYVNFSHGYIHHSRIPTYLMLKQCSKWFMDSSLDNLTNKLD